MARKPIQSLASWFGGKGRMAPHVIGQFGPHKEYYEPFCGSLAVLLRKQPARRETVNDLHGDLINLARVVADPQLCRELYRRLRRLVVGEGIHRHAKFRMDERPVSFEAEPDLERAYHYFTVAWMSRGGSGGTKTRSFCASYRGASLPVRWQSAVQSIPSWHRRMQGVTILNRDAYDVLSKIVDREGTLIYVDPPYVGKGRDYVHDLAEGGHERLAELLRRFRRARVVVSYYDHPAVNGFYAGWQRQSIQIDRSLMRPSRKTKAEREETEVILVNGPLLQCA